VLRSKQTIPTSGLKHYNMYIPCTSMSTDTIVLYHVHSAFNRLPKRRKCLLVCFFYLRCCWGWWSRPRPRRSGRRCFVLHWGRRRGPKSLLCRQRGNCLRGPRWKNPSELIRSGVLMKARIDRGAPIKI
jgi:hypothetical protein